MKVSQINSGEFLWYRKLLIWMLSHCCNHLSSHCHIFIKCWIAVYLFCCSSLTCWALKDLSWSKNCYITVGTSLDQHCLMQTVNLRQVSCVHVRDIAGNYGVQTVTYLVTACLQVVSIATQICSFIAFLFCNSLLLMWSCDASSCW